MEYWRVEKIEVHSDTTVYTLVDTGVDEPGAHVVLIVPKPGVWELHDEEAVFKLHCRSRSTIRNTLPLRYTVIVRNQK